MDCKSLTVLHLLSTDSFSGAESVAIDIIREMCVRYGIRGVYASPSGTIQDRLSKEGIKYEALLRMRLTALRDVLSKVDPDVIHAHDATAGVMAAACHGRAKVVCHIHHNSPWLRRPGLKSIALSWALRHIDRVLTVSSSVQNEYVFRKSLVGKYDCVGNPIDIVSVREKATAFDVGENYATAFVGRWAPSKNPRLFCEVAAMVLQADAHSRIALIGAKTNSSEAYSQLKAAGVDMGRIDAYGFCENPYPIISAATSLCMPSLWEGFGLAAAEALSLGVPVICSGAGGLSTLVDDSCGLICEYNAGCYAEEILRLAKNEGYRSKKSAAALQRASEIDNIDEYMEHLEHIYNSLVVKR